MEKYTELESAKLDLWIKDLFTRPAHGHYDEESGFVVYDIDKTDSQPRDREHYDL